MKAVPFSTRLRSWRKGRRIKQASLATDLGVSQAAISRWENGLDLPSAATLARLQSIMQPESGAWQVEQRHVERLASCRALFAAEGMRLLAASQGMQRLWPGLARMAGQRFADLLVGDAAAIFGPGDSAAHVRQGGVLHASGVAIRHTMLDREPPRRHRWHACLRRIDGAAVVDVSFEPCAGDAPLGIEDLFTG